MTYKQIKRIYYWVLGHQYRVEIKWGAPYVSHEYNNYVYKIDENGTAVFIWDFEYEKINL